MKNGKDLMRKKVRVDEKVQQERRKKNLECLLLEKLKDEGIS